MLVLSGTAKHFLAVSTCALLLMTGCQKENAYQEPPPPKVKVALPVVQPVTQYYEFTGTTASVDTVELKARVTGYLHKVHFKDGARVKAGELLFTIEQDPFRITLEQAKANLRKAEAAYALSVADLARVETLVKKNVATSADLDTTVAERDSNLAQIEAEKAAVQRAELDMKYTEIRSPIDGRVGRRMIDEGNIVLAQETLLTTVEAYDPVYVYFNVSERELLEFRANLVKNAQDPEHRTPVPLQMGLLTDVGYPYSGFSDYTDPGVDASTGTLLVRGTFPNPDGGILPGLFVRIRAPQKVLPQALLVPDLALGTNQEGKYLLVVDAENKVQQKTVTTGSKIGEFRVILTGITAADRVVISGLQRAQPDSLVVPVVEKLSPPSASAVDQTAETIPAKSGTSQEGQPTQKTSETPAQPAGVSPQADAKKEPSSPGQGN